MTPDGQIAIPLDTAAIREPSSVCSEAVSLQWVEQKREHQNHLHLLLFHPCHVWAR